MCAVSLTLFLFAHGLAPCTLFSVCPCISAVLLCAGFPCSGSGPDLAEGERVSPGWEQSHAARPCPPLRDSLYAGDGGPLILRRHLSSLPRAIPFLSHITSTFLCPPGASTDPFSSAVFLSGRSCTIPMLIPSRCLFLCTLYFFNPFSFMTIRWNPTAPITKIFLISLLWSVFFVTFMVCEAHLGGSFFGNI